MYLWLIFKYVLFSIFTFTWAQLLTFGVEREKSDSHFKREKWQDDGDRCEERHNSIIQADTQESKKFLDNQIAYLREKIFLPFCSLLDNWC